MIGLADIWNLIQEFVLYFVYDCYILKNAFLNYFLVENVLVVGQLLLTTYIKRCPTMDVHAFLSVLCIESMPLEV